MMVRKIGDKRRRRSLTRSISAVYPVLVALGWGQAQAAASATRSIDVTNLQRLVLQRCLGPCCEAATGPTVTVARTVGLQLYPGECNLTHESLLPHPIAVSSSVTQGIIVHSTPARGTTVNVNSRVTLDYSNQPSGLNVEVLDVVGEPLKQAEETLIIGLLKTGVIKDISTTEYPPGTVLAEFPLPGTSVLAHTAINLEVAEAPA